MDTIIEDNRIAAATRMVRLLASSSVFSPEVQQAIRLEGMKLLSEPRNLVYGSEVAQCVPNSAMKGFSTQRALREDI